MWSPRVIALKLTKISHSVGHKIPLCHLKGLHFLCGRFRFSSANNCDAEQRFMSSEPKRIRIDEMGIKKIGTHNGTFHCDEVLACFFLRQLPEYAEAEIVRTRDTAVLAECDVVVDVGGEFDPKRHRYDHHQRYRYIQANFALETRNK